MNLYNTLKFTEKLGELSEAVLQFIDTKIPVQEKLVIETMEAFEQSDCGVMGKVRNAYEILVLYDDEQLKTIVQYGTLLIRIDSLESYLALLVLIAEKSRKLDKK